MKIICMKITHLVLTLLVIMLIPVSNVCAQKSAATSLTYVSAKAKLTKVYTREELEKMGKLELTTIYQERIAIITEIIPYLALHSKPGATLSEMGIPQTAANTDHLEKEVKNKQVYLSSVNETLDDIIPYADKQNIIWSILFFEEMILKSDYTNTTSGSTSQTPTDK
ncbi:MAG: hypothetical protein H7259_08870 [Cytophagales bacterium]|nr:hypothetical protein [Cytophaga sp.]